MNKNKYNIIRAFSFIFGLIPSFISLFCRRKEKTIIFNSQFNCTFEHNSRALFLYLLEHNDDGFTAKFVINDARKRKNLIKKYGEHFITNYRIADVVKILSSSIWICSSLETPLVGIGLRFRRTVIHLGHGAPLKAIGLGEKYVSPIKSIYYRLIRSNFSYFMSSSELFDRAWADCLKLPYSRVIRCPQARCDQVVSPVVNELEIVLDKNNYNILYAPTWRPMSETKLFPFDDFSSYLLSDFLEKKCINFYLRLHPNFESKIDVEILEHNRLNILGVADVSDINSILGEFDLLITDYSSIYVDFLLTEKPVLFLPYDYEEYEKTVGFSIDYEKCTPGPKPVSLMEFLSELENLLINSNYYLDARRGVNKILNPITSEHAKKALCTVKELSSR